MAGWGQGYADTLGYAALHPGSGADHFVIERVVSDANTRVDEGRALLGHGNTTGTGILVDPGGIHLGP